MIGINDCRLILRNLSNPMETVPNKHCPIGKASVSIPITPSLFAQLQPFLERSGVSKYVPEFIARLRSPEYKYPRSFLTDNSLDLGDSVRAGEYLAAVVVGKDILLLTADCSPAMWGNWFGFPQCCVKEFVRKYPNYRPKRKLDGTGFIPCRSCSATKSESNLKQNIKALRLVPTTFPKVSRSSKGIIGLLNFSVRSETQ